MIYNLGENEPLLIQYIKNGEKKTIDMLSYMTSDDCSDTNDVETILYETNGNTGLLGLNKSNISGNWQLEMDLSPYKTIKCYFKQSDHDLANKSLTPSVMVELPLDETSLAKSVVNANIGSIKTSCDIYIGGMVVSMPNEITSFYRVTVAVDNEKKHFKIVDQYIINGEDIKFANNDGRYLYKIIGIK